MPNPVTLGDLITGGKLMWAYCIACCRDSDIDPTALPLPAATPVPGLGRRHMRCSGCGSKEIETRPELSPGGVETARRRLR
jgi:hypothetical protein